MLGSSHGLASLEEIQLLRNGVHWARSEEEKEAVYRFRYEIYVSEMGRYAGIADHENLRFREPEDDTARIFYAASDEKS